MKRIIFIFIMILCLLTCDFFKEVDEMSVEKIIPPTPSSPGTTDDYNQQNVLIQSEIFKFNENFLHLTNWDNLLQPVIKQGVYVSHGGSLFLVKNTDEIISGLPADGRVYIRATQSGDFLTFDFVNSATGYSWNYVYCGFYNAGGQQLLPYVLWKTINGYYKYLSRQCGNPYDIESLIEEKLIKPIGTWNMDAAEERSIPFDDIESIIFSLVTTQEFLQLITLEDCIIISDGPPNPEVASQIVRGGRMDIDFDQKRFEFHRTLGGVFDGIEYDSAIINRGYFIYSRKI